MVHGKDDANNERGTQMNPYDEGAKSFKQGRLGNPYSLNSNNNRSWEYGFNTAYFFNLKKVRDNEQRIRERSEKVYAEEANT